MRESADPVWLRLLPALLRDRLAGRANLFAIIHNSGWLLFDKLVRILLALLVGAWVARYLGPAQFGELAYVLAYIAFFQAVANLGMDGIVVRDIARNKEDAGQILGTAFALRVVAGTLCWLAAVGGMAWLHGWQDRSVWLTALAGGSLIFQAADTVDLWFQSQSQSRRTVVAKLVAYVISNGVKVWLILVDAPLFAFATVMAFDALSAAIGLAIAYWRFPCNRRWHYIARQGWQLLRESWLFILSGISVMIYMRIDQIMIKEMLGEKALGVYAVVLPLSSLWHVVPLTLCTSLAPFIARKKIENEMVYYDSLLKVFRGFLLVSILAVVFTVAISSLLINLMYGAAYSEAVNVLNIHVFSNVSVFLGLAQGLWIANERKPRIVFFKTVIGGVTSVVGNLLLIPIFGLAGAAITAVFAYFISAIFSNIIFAQKIFLMQFGIRPRRYV